ncbi:hypothetical protein [Krasilnikovia sp. MM14-A1004]|uniref:hypothetical protein n=1 Tax=Krasilnikovia sp. MM14-A1004 TaxID=3373541 RepID=UPI00399D08D3
MRAHTTRVLSLAAAGAAAAVALLGLSGCGAEHEATAAAQPAAVQAAGAQQTAGAAQAAPAGAAQTPEGTFIAVTAAHLCKVQSTVYDNPKAMAEAYQATPAYPGLTKAQVTAFQKKLTADTAFAKQLSTNLQQTCKPGS